MADFYAMQTRIKRMLAYEAEQQNPVLGDGEPLYESDTGGLKIGNGNSRYNDLKYTGIVVTAGQLKLTGIVDTWEELPTGQNGDVYLVREDGKMYTFIGSAWQPKGSGATIKGDTGPKGDRGDTGLKGDKGDRGDIGPKGDQGLPGLQGPKGDKGDKGEQAEGGPIELAMAVSAAEFGVPGTDVWYSIPGLDVTVTTGDRPAYVSVDFGIVVTDGVTRPVTSLSPRIWDDTAGVSLATGYIQALNPLPNSDPQYLLTQPPSLGVRLPAGWTNHRLLVQVQIPGDQAGPGWQFNTNWIPTQSSIRVVAT